MNDQSKLKLIVTVELVYRDNCLRQNVALKKKLHEFIAHHESV